jgi:hypothetical protein
MRIELALIDIFNDFADGYFRSLTQLRDRTFAIVLQIFCTTFQLGADEGVAFRAIFRIIFLEHLIASFAIINIESHGFTSYRVMHFSIEDISSECDV